ncbi:alpha-amylase family protein [Nonomuraea solani]|uniref:alpha-amylase family protein n=1 Tax=Nonomuraea solani TaxID=1144553 RepID=UPI0013576AAA|nr:alpha-amylase family protein [Nonomuraea solani]
MPDGDLDTGAATKLIKRLGFNVWLLNAGGISYFYPVAGETQEMSPALRRRASGDLIADALADCRRQGMRLVTRFDFSRLPSRFVRANPEWAFLTADGGMCEADGLTNICPRSDYYDKRVPEILADFVDRYDVDGVFFNWMQFPVASYTMDFYGTCHCERCVAAFRDAHPDLEYPTGFQHGDHAVLTELNGRYLRETAERYARLVKSRRPGIALFLADAPVDLVFLETNSPITANEHWWEHTPGELASAHKTAHPDTPAMVHSSQNVGLPYRLIGEEPAQYARYFAQALARGARPSAVVIGRPTTEHFSAFERSTPVLEIYRNNRDLYADLRPCAPVAIVRPPGGTAMASMQYRSDFTEYRGIFESLQQRHIPFDVLGAEYATELAGTLGRYSVIAVPGDAITTPELAAALRAFADDGGELVVTGDPSALVPDLPVTRVLEGMLQLGGRFGARPDGRFGDRLPLLGTFWGVEGGEHDGWLLSEQAPFGPPELTYGNERFTRYPLRVRLPQITLLPWTAGTTQRASGLSSVAGFIADTVADRLGDARILSAEFATSVEIVVGRSGGSLVVHLINHSGGRPERLIDPVPIRGRLRVPRRVAGDRPVVTSPSGASYEVRDEPDAIVIELEVGAVEVIRVD